MPITGPCTKKLNVQNVLLVTQVNATTPKHREAFLEVFRVDDIAKNKTGKRSKEAKQFLSKLKDELLEKSDEMSIKRTHVYWPDSYFLAMCPRYMKPPGGSKSLILRWKIGNTKKFPFSCLELKDENGVFLPWTTIHTKFDGFKKCGMNFKDYSSLVRHLATRHMV